jgi:hypothetical protein
MKISFVSTFRSSGKNNVATKGKLRFKYKVTGTKEELADFETSRGDFFIKDDDGTPLFNSLNYVGKSTNLVKTQDGRYIADTSALDTANSLAEQFPFLAAELAKDTLKSVMGVNATVAPVVVETKEA